MCEPHKEPVNIASDCFREATVTTQCSMHVLAQCQFLTLFRQARDPVKWMPRKVNWVCEECAKHLCYPCVPSLWPLKQNQSGNFKGRQHSLLITYSIQVCLMFGPVAFSSIEISAHFFVKVFSSIPNACSIVVRYLCTGVRMGCFSVLWPKNFALNNHKWLTIACGIAQ